MELTARGLKAAPLGASLVEVEVGVDLIGDGFHRVRAGVDEEAALAQVHAEAGLEHLAVGRAQGSDTGGLERPGRRGRRVGVDLNLWAFGLRIWIEKKNWGLRGRP